VNPWTQGECPTWTGERRVFKLLSRVEHDAQVRENMSRAAKARLSRTVRGAGGKFGALKPWALIGPDAKPVTPSECVKFWPLLSEAR